MCVMATTFLKLPSGKCLCFDNIQRSTAADLYTTVHKTTTIPDEDFYLICNGRRVVDSDPVNPGATYHVIPRLLGGKGGFGSMLRAIGAQIEKTTSREACRDLSGRRMRDVNNEKKLREWVSKKADREREREERRQQRLERRRAIPQHKFDNPDYEEQKRTVVENLDNALEEGLKNAAIVSSGHKRKSEDPGPSTSKKSRDWFGEDSDEASDLDLDSNTSDSEGRASPGPSGAGPSTSSEDPSSSEPSTPRPSSPQTGSSVAAQSDSKNQSDSSEPSNSHIEPSGVSAQKDTVKDTASGMDTDGGQLKEPSSTSDVQEEPVKTETPAVITKSHSPPTENPSQEPPKKPEGPVELDLSLYTGPEDLEPLGLEVLKAALMARSLKCGGSLTERADRLYSVKGLTRDQIKPALFAKGGKVKGKK